MQDLTKEHRDQTWLKSKYQMCCADAFAQTASKPCSGKEKVEVRKRVGEDGSGRHMHLRISPGITCCISRQLSVKEQLPSHLPSAESIWLKPELIPCIMFLKPLNEYTCTVPVCSVRELPSTQGASLLEVLL